MMEYKTIELGEATVLVMRGHNFLGFQMSDELRSNQAYFVFEDTEDLKADALAYWRGKVQVDARRFWNEQQILRRSLKAEIGL